MTAPRRMDPRILIAILAFAAALVPRSLARQAAPASHKPLTVPRIYANPPLGGSLPSGGAWRPDGSSYSFMKIGSGATEFHQLDVATGRERPAITPDKFLRLLAQSRAGVVSAPEDATQDVVGIKAQATGANRNTPPSYLWSPNGNSLLFVVFPAVSNGAFLYDIKKDEARPLISSEQFHNITDVRFSPNGQMVSFVRDHNLFVVPVSGGEPVNVTVTGTEQIRRGELDWVYPEELACRTAYWWSPDSSHIAFLEMDERRVLNYPMLSFQAVGALSESQRYPLAGTHNPVVRVGVVDVAPGKPAGGPRWMDTGAEKDIYLPRVTWTPDSSHLAIQRLNRAQDQLDLLAADASTGRSETILQEKDQYWINVHGDPVFINGGKDFLWTSDRDGFRHIYVQSTAGGAARQLTRGKWEADFLNVDEKAGAVYFVATEKSPIERHLYRVPLGGGAITRITKEAGNHAVSIAPDGRHYLDTYSNINTPPRQDIYSVDGTHLATLAENSVPELADYKLVQPEFGKIAGPSGDTLYTMTIRPPNFDPSKKYPVLIYTYGGPGTQVVRDVWEPTPRRWQAYLWHQMMAQHGYVIFELDNRGSPGRGHAFETPMYRHMGRVELEDQLAGVAYLKSLPYVDPARIGIWGWSYGGFMTLNAMLRAPGVFRAGFAGSPVSDLRLYDTIYTERYMGQPFIPGHGPSEGYRDSAPLNFAAQLQGKLLIAFGTGDDNVHMENSIALQNEFIKAGKYAEFVMYPDRGHPISDHDARVHLFNRVTQFFLDNL